MKSPTWGPSQYNNVQVSPDSFILTTFPLRALQVARSNRLTPAPKAPPKSMNVKSTTIAHEVWSSIYTCLILHTLLIPNHPPVQQILNVYYILDVSTRYLQRLSYDRISELRDVLIFPESIRSNTTTLTKVSSPGSATSLIASINSRGWS